MLQCIFLLSDSGEVMLEKQLRDPRVDRSICVWFWEHALSVGDPLEVEPILASPTHYVFQIVREGVTFLACTQVEMPSLLAIEFLSRVADVLSDYLGGLNEDAIKDNFVIVYELLDEMIDNGFPLTTEPNMLKEMVSPPNIVTKMLSVVTGANVSSTSDKLPTSLVPWRSSGVRHSRNEVYVDLVEEMDVTIDRHGKPVKCEVYGEITVDSRMSGFPDVTLSLADASVMTDVSFHPSVRLRHWESHRALSFVPPDGPFKLMSYRVRDLENHPLYVRPQVTSDAGMCRVSVLLGIAVAPPRPVDSVTLRFNLPPRVASVDVGSNHGTIAVLPDKVCVWTVGRIPDDKTPSLTATLSLEPGVERTPVSPTFRVGFRIQGVALSGLSVRSLDVADLPHPLYKGFRALTRAGDYDVRS